MKPHSEAQKIKRKSGIKVTLLLLCFSLLCGQAGAQESKIGQSSTRRIHCMGQSWKLPVYATSEPGVVMLRADQQALFSVARALGQSLNWSSSDTTLSGVGDSSISLGQQSLEVHGQEKTLAVVPQVIEGAVHIPSSSLEGLLNCRVTVKQGSQGAIYVEPILDSVSFINEQDSSTDLQLKTSVPVRKKVFTLKNPRRTVVDLVGVALPENFEGIEHPSLGQIRVGQFQLAPSTTRIVLPADGGVKVKKKRTLDLYEHQLSIKWPAGSKPGSIKKRPGRVPTVAIKPTKMPERATVISIKGKDVKTTRPKPAKANSKGRAKLQKVAWEKNRLKLSFSQPVSYRWSRVNTGKKRFVIDFPGVVYPTKKSQHSSPIPGLKGVRVVQNMPEPQPIVRLVCDLKSPLAVETKGADETVLYLSFPGRKVSSSEFPRGTGHTSKNVKANPSGRTVCIDAGHGGSDPGALNRAVGINEKTVTLDISLRLAKILKKQGWNVIMTRSSDRDVSWAGSSAKQELGARAKMANSFGADLFISVHANASVKPSINGTSIHWYKSSDYRLARLMESGVMNATGRKNRGLIKNRFYVLAHTEMPAVLVETAFLTNAYEGSLLAKPHYRERIAQGIASGLQVYASRTYPTTAAKK